MANYPLTYNDFVSFFSSDEDCYAFLSNIRWVDGFICPHCQNRTHWYGGKGNYECYKCKKRCSVTAGTLFQDHKKPLLLWFRAMWHITENKYGTNALSLKNALGLGSYNTAWTWLHKFRAAMVRPNRDKLSGLVEVDEIFIGGPKSGKRGRGAEGKELVLVMAEKDEKRIGRIRLRHIANATADTLNAAICEAVNSGACLCTDGWSGYSTSQLAEKLYIHQVVRKDACVGDNLLPFANIVASLLKRWLLGTLQGGIQPTHLGYYLDEFTFRFNRRTSKSRGLLFYRLVEQALIVEPKVEKSFRNGKLALGEKSTYSG